MARLFIGIAALSGFFAVALGAFGAHALRGSLDAYSLGVFETAVDYHFFHSLALLGVGLLCQSARGADALLTASGTLFAAGILIFSGSLYLLAISGLRWLGAITPVGGVCFLLGWVALFVWAMRRSPADD